jgi:cytochrome bd ubiquinol oxidase subunit II
VIAAFVQGAAIGAMIRGVPVANGQYAGGAFEWLAPLPVLTGIGLVLGYALLGAGWIVLKSDGELSEWARERISWLALALLAVLIVASDAAFAVRARIGADLSNRLWGLIFPGIGFLAMAGMLIGVRQRRRRHAVRDDRRGLHRLVLNARRFVLALH